MLQRPWPFVHLKQWDFQKKFVIRPMWFKVLLTYYQMAEVKVMPKLTVFVSLAGLYYPCGQPTFQLHDQEAGVTGQEKKGG